MNQVDVICLSYNHEKYIADALRSIKDQVLFPAKVILVDDCSTDDTVKIAKSAGLSNLQVIANPANQGIFKLGSNMNAALKQVTSKYVAILEGDDYWFRRKLAAQVAYAEANALDIVGARGFLDFNGKLKPIHYFGLKQAIAGYNRGDPATLVFRDYFLPSTSLVFRTELLKRIGGFVQLEDVPFIDVPTLGKCLGQARIGWVKERLSVWRVHERQASQVRNREMREGFIRCGNEILEHSAVAKSDRQKLKVALDRYARFLALPSLARLLPVLLARGIPAVTKIYIAKKCLDGKVISDQ